ITLEEGHKSRDGARRVGAKGGQSGEGGPALGALRTSEHVEERPHRGDASGLLTFHERSGRDEKRECLRSRPGSQLLPTRAPGGPSRSDCPNGEGRPGWEEERIGAGELLKGLRGAATRSSRRAVP